MTKKKMAQAMVTKGFVKVMVNRTESFSIHEVEKITDSGRIYIKGHHTVLFFNAKEFAGDMMWMSKYANVRKPSQEDIEQHQMMQQRKAVS